MCPKLLACFFLEVLNDRVLWYVDINDVMLWTGLIQQWFCLFRGIIGIIKRLRDHPHGNAFVYKRFGRSSKWIL